MFGPSVHALNSILLSKHMTLCAHLLSHLCQLVLQLEPVLLRTSQGPVALSELAQQRRILLPLLLKGIVGLVDLCSSSAAATGAAAAEAKLQSMDNL
jgi:hypothetical protein